MKWCIGEFVVVVSLCLPTERGQACIHCTSHADQFRRAHEHSALCSWICRENLAFFTEAHHEDDHWQNTLPGWPVRAGFNSFLRTPFVELFEIEHLALHLDVHALGFRFLQSDPCHTLFKWSHHTSKTCSRTWSEKTFSLFNNCYYGTFSSEEDGPCSPCFVGLGAHVKSMWVCECMLAKEDAVNENLYYTLYMSPSCSVRNGFHYFIGAQLNPVQIVTNLDVFVSLF